jgi:hypothetical protein
VVVTFELRSVQAQPKGVPGERTAAANSNNGMSRANLDRASCGRTGICNRDVRLHLQGARMAKYSKSASDNVESTMRRRKKGTLKSSSGRKVTSRKQAIAIALSEAREKGAKVPKKPASTRKRASKKR